MGTRRRELLMILRVPLRLLTSRPSPAGLTLVISPARTRMRWMVDDEVRRLRARSVFICAAMFVAAIAIRHPRAQTNPAIANQKPPAFDAAAIRPNPSGGEPGGSYGAPGGRLPATNTTLRLLIKPAYAVYDSQIVGGPRWIDSDRW